MSVWINGRRGAAIDYRDRGLQYGDGLFETMRVRRGAVRLLDYHVQRLYLGCARLHIAPPDERRLRREIARAAALRDEGVLKLIVTRGVGARGYRPSGRERTTRILALGALPAHAGAGARTGAKLRLCATRLGTNAQLAGVKSLNRLEQVMARLEWRDARILEGLMLDADANIVCGTMSNVFVRRGGHLLTPPVDRCGVAGVMRRWVLEQAAPLGLRPSLRRLQFEDLVGADEVFISNAVVGVMPVAVIAHRKIRLRLPCRAVARSLQKRLEAV